MKEAANRGWLVYRRYCKMLDTALAPTIILPAMQRAIKATAAQIKRGDGTAVIDWPSGISRHTVGSRNRR
jgi:hypothetical protein